ncbi:RING-type domain-containing protein [Caenorhabditis elegans]|nr:RING-type domain-containing protein [Caenorhabditis elegans]CDO50120.1 RING-type domain-containing protein [Caenorhabditis elegans]|eukprot:NP_001293392.1 Uncharacterized protein CELE_Y51F10.2 [Caenorhabditis elegans]
MDSMRGEADHNISFLACVGCNGVYHEKDTNICTTCSPIIKDAHPTELIEQGVILNQYALCSTCLLRDHIKKNHVSISLQPLRVEMQRQENQRRIVGLQDNLHKVQRDFREQLNATMERWAGWNGSHDLSMDKFRELGDTYNQKKVYDAFVHQLRGKTAKIEKLAEHVLRWNDELDREMERPPAHRLPRSSTPAPAPPFDNSVAYYFEHQF